MNRSKRLVAVLIMLSMSLLAACGGGGGGGNPIPNPTPTPTPTAPPNSADCPTSGSSPSSVLLGYSGSASVGRQGPSVPITGSNNIPGTLVITYSPTVSAAQISSDVARTGARGRADLDLRAIGVHATTVSVDPSDAQRVASALRELPGVLNVQPAQYRHALAATPNDPTYRGNNIPPYYQTANSQGQWDMHVLNLDTAWAVFPSTVVTGAPIAIIDTGVDVTQLELTGGKIIRTRCFVTYPAGTAQTTGPYVTDTDGHGTNVTGIADADTNNNLDTAGVAWSAPLLAYRIFPSDPAGGCEGSTSPQCETNDVDEASAINDAVANGAKVINLSLGASPPCNSSIENQAISGALSANVAVVAAAGNEMAANLDCPAALPGVIAVGASALRDSVTPIQEYVASYSNYLTTTGGGYYMVAPGGDPSGGTDNDQLHWINNLYSSTGPPVSGKPTICGTNCANYLFAGTSQATPHVVGIVSLMRAINTHLTLAQMASDLCSTADNISDSKQGCGRVNAGKAVSLAATQ